jgi:nitrite reductase (NADH) small subunit
VTVKHPVGSVADFQPGTAKVVQVGSRSIGVINSAGKLYAVLNVCPHALAAVCEWGTVTGTQLPCLPGELRYGMEGRILRCPWHGYEFDLETGEAVFTNFRGKLRTFPVSIDDDQVLIEVKDRGGAASSPAITRATR